MSSKYGDVEILMKQIIEIIKVGFFDENSLNVVNSKLDQLNLYFQKFESNKCIRMRKNLIENIVQNNNKMRQVFNEEECTEKAQLHEMEIISNNLNEWIKNIGKDIEKILDTVRIEPKSNHLEAVQYLINETESSYTLTLSIIHELTASMIELPNSRKLHDKLTEIRQNNINCLTKLLEMYATMSSLASTNNSNPKFNDSDIQEKLNILKNTIEINSSNWMKNLQNLLIQLEQFNNFASDKSVSKSESFNSTTLIEKINYRLNHLIKCIHKNVTINYEDELKVLNQALSQFELNPIDLDKETHDLLKTLKTKLKELQDLIKNRTSSSISAINLINIKIENDLLINCYSKELFIDTLKHLQNRHRLISVKSSLIEKDFLNDILNPNEFLSYTEIQDVERSENEKLNQYRELSQVFHCFIEALKLYIQRNSTSMMHNLTDPESEIKIMKDAMMVSTTTISMLENYSKLIFTDKTENDLFTQTTQSEVCLLLNNVVEKIIDNEKIQNILNIFLEETKSLIKSLEEELERLLTNSTWNENHCKDLLHKSFWLVNIWQYNNKPVECSKLCENFKSLIKLVNSLKKEQFKHLASNHLHQETTREYWFQILQNWQNRVDTLLSHNLSKSDDWKLFGERIHLICEFQQIDSNIDHYEVKFESDFLDSLISQKCELDKINKLFIDRLVNKKEPIYKYLQFISKEIKDLNEIKSKDHNSMESIEMIQKSTQTAMQILEYIQSLLDKIDENYVDKSQISNEQIRKLQLALYASKKSFTIYSNQIGRLNEELNEKRTSLDKLEESVESIETFMKSEINTLLANGFDEMLNRCTITIQKIKVDINTFESQLLPYESDQLKSVREAVNFIKKRLLKIQKQVPKIEQKMNNFKMTISVIIDQQNQTLSLKKSLQIYLKKVDVYCTGIDMKAITCKKSVENYLRHIDQLFNEIDIQNNAIKQIEIIDYKILENNSQKEKLKFIFDSEIAQLTDSFKSIDLLKQVKINLTEKNEVLTEIDKKFKFCILEIDKTKHLILSESGNINNKISQNIETIRDVINQFHLFLHQKLNIIDKDHMSALSKDLEQMDALLDVYDEYIKNKKDQENKKQHFIKSITDKHEKIHKDLQVINISNNLSWDMNAGDFLSQLEEILYQLIFLKNEILKSSIDIYINDLKDSQISELSQDCYFNIIKSIQWHLSCITEVLLSQFTLSCDFDNIFHQTCKKWSTLIKNFIEYDDDKLAYHDKLVHIETIKMILDCFMTVTEHCEKLALSEELINKIVSFRNQICNLISKVKIILESSEKLNTKLSDFQLMRNSLSVCSDKLNFHLLLVKSLSEDCGVQKHIQMKQQSNFYRAYIKYHYNLYRLFNQIYESIFDENVLGFEIEDSIQISLEEMNKNIETINKKHENALEDINTSLTEWEKSWHTEISTKRFLILLSNVFEEINGKNLLNKVYYQTILEKLSFIIQHLKDKEFQWSNLKIRIGSSSDQAYLQQRIKITQACLSIGQTIVICNSTYRTLLLSQYQDLYIEAENITLNLLTLLNDSHCFYLENELTFNERQKFLTQFTNSLNQIEKTVEIWKMRSKKIFPNLFVCYCSNIGFKSQSLEEWFRDCLKTLDEIALNLNEYESIYNTMQIKLNVIGEYLEEVESCDAFIKNIAAKFFKYNTADLQNSIKLSETIIQQMNQIEFQLQELHNLKEQLYQLMLAQNDNSQECDKGKLADFEQVVKVILDSQITIKEELLNLLNQSPKKTLKSTLSYSCCEEEIKSFDKNISVSGDVESFILISSNKVNKTNSSDSIKIKLPFSSITEQTENQISNLKDLFKKVISSVDEQEVYLNDKWKKKAFNDLNIIELNCDNKIELDNKNLFSTSTPLSVPLKQTDMHHWFPNTSEASIQTLNNSDMELNPENVISSSQISSELSLTCPNFHLSGLTSSEEFKQSNSNIMEMTHNEKNTEALNIKETDNKIRQFQNFKLSTDVSISVIECLDQNKFYPNLQTKNKEQNYENVDLTVDNIPSISLEINNQYQEMSPKNLNNDKMLDISDEHASFSKGNIITNEFYKTGKCQNDSLKFFNENRSEMDKQNMAINVLDNILHDMVYNLIKDDLPEPSAIYELTKSDLTHEINENLMNKTELSNLQNNTLISSGNGGNNMLLEMKPNVNIDEQEQTANANKMKDAIYINFKNDIEDIEKENKSDVSANNQVDIIGIKQNIYEVKLENDYKFTSNFCENNDNSNVRGVYNANNENINLSINVACTIKSKNHSLNSSDEGLNIYIEQNQNYINEVSMDKSNKISKDKSNSDNEFDGKYNIENCGNKNDLLSEAFSEISENESCILLNRNLNDTDKSSEIKNILNIEVSPEIECDEFNVVKREVTNYAEQSIIKLSEISKDAQSNEDKLKGSVNNCIIKEVITNESLVISSPFTIDNTNMNVKDNYKRVENSSKSFNREQFGKNNTNSKICTKLISDSQTKGHQNDCDKVSSLNLIDLKPSTNEINIKCSGKSLMTETANLCIPKIADDECLENINNHSNFPLYNALKTFEDLFTDILINEIDNKIENETDKCRGNEVEKSDFEIYNETPIKNSKLSEKSSFTGINVENLNKNSDFLNNIENLEDKDIKNDNNLFNVKKSVLEDLVKLEILTDLHTTNNSSCRNITFNESENNINYENLNQTNNKPKNIVSKTLKTDSYSRENQTESNANINKNYLDSIHYRNNELSKSFSDKKNSLQNYSNKFILNLNTDDKYEISGKPEFRKYQNKILSMPAMQQSITILAENDMSVRRKRSKSLEIYSHISDSGDKSITNSTSQKMPIFSQSYGKIENLMNDYISTNHTSKSICQCGLLKFLLICLLLALFIVFYIQMPIVTQCDNLYYDILKYMNPFHIKRYVPV